MGNKLTVVISGRKMAGKSSLGKYIATEYLNKIIGQKRFILEKLGKEVFVVDTLNNNQSVILDYPNDISKQIADTYSVKMYSFADPLKKFCIDIFGLDLIQCYGSDDDKDSDTHIMWDDIPEEIRIKYSRVRRGSGAIKPANGYMTAREVMQIVGTDVVRRFDTNAWARGLYSTIENEGYDLAIVCDARFPNEVTIGTEKNAKAIRLTRIVNDDPHESEHALDNFPLGEYTLVVDNQDKTMNETHKTVKPHVFNWLERNGL